MSTSFYDHKILCNKHPPNLSIRHKQSFGSQLCMPLGSICQGLTYLDGIAYLGLALLPVVLSSFEDLRWWV